MKTVIAAMLTILVISDASAGEVYKWTDADGKVHFSAHPPAGKAKTVEIKKYRGGSPAPARNIDQDQQEFIDAYKQQLMKVDGSEATFDCSVAMDNLNWQFETMFTQGERNLNSGVITKEQHDQAKSSLQKAQNQMSYSRCQSATGVERSFYECMSNKNNHMAGCGTKHDFLGF
jgi:hypothetical protein